MNADRFRALALALPEVVEQSHMDHPDFRVGGTIFASIGPDGDWAMVRLTPDEQELFMTRYPEMFRAANGAWGRNGATIIMLTKARVPVIREALRLAWCDRAPKRLVRGK